MKNSYITLTDQFCGAGGSSIGAVKAGAEVKLALNHWKLAVDTHNTNFPNTDHDCADISAANPRRYGSTDILITSPECTNHSQAKGKARQAYDADLFGNILIDPEDERSRATMWDVPRFAEYHDYRIVIVENVAEAAKWRLWDAWLKAMSDLGYDHEVIYFNSMFSHPTPQSRDRLYTVFWKRGNRKPDLEFRPAAYCIGCGTNVEAIQTWKKRLKWGKYKTQYFYRCPNCSQEVTPYYFAAFNAIDWTIPAIRIGDRKKPLVPKTMARVKYGFDNFGRQVMIVTGRDGVDFRVKKAIDDAFSTQTAYLNHAVLFPWMVETSYSQSGDNRAYNVVDPMSTRSTRQSLGMAMPGFIADLRGTSNASELDKPLKCVTSGGNHHALLNLPGGMIVSVNDFDPRTLPLDRALGTQTTQEKWAVAFPSFIDNMRGKSSPSKITDPLMCVTANDGHHALLSADAFLTYYYGTGLASRADEPMGTVSTRDRVGLVQAMDRMTLEDLTFRMLHPHEIGAAMAFPKSYVVLGTNKQKVKMYGNAVTPPVMEMIMQRCMESLA
jgi:DNA (cytosine-5)-methyltransferase 1